MQSTENLLLKGPEVAQILNISRPLAYKWMQQGILPTVRVPGARVVRVPREALLDWIKRNTQAEAARG